MGVVQLARHIGHHGQQLFGVGHGFVERGVEVHRGCAQNVDQHLVVQCQIFTQLGGKSLRVFEVLHPQGTPSHFVFISGPNATASGADLGGARFFFGGLAAHIQRNVVRQDQGASLAYAQPRTNLDTGFFKACDFFQQFGHRQDHAVADVALDACTHDAAGNQVQSSFDAVDDQGMACVVSPLETHHALGAFGQPVHQFAFAFVAPLGTDDDHITALLHVHA